MCRSVARLLALWKSSFAAPFISQWRSTSDIGEQALQRRARRWVREIVLAVLLTVAAAAFITAALLRGNGAPGMTPSFETARKPATQ